jgi:hypothetical protein
MEMLDMRQKKAVTKELKKRYNRASKKKRTIMLDEFCAVTGYNRCYASWILKFKKDKVLGYVKTGGKTIKFVADKKKKGKKKKGRPRIYTYDVFLALKRIWTIFDFICGKRLAPFIAEATRKLEKHGEINITAGVRKKLKSISASTIDRLLKKEKEKFRLGKGRSGTRPGTLLKKSIPIRTFSDWDDAVPGFCECDLVGHDGGNTSGDFAQSLNFTDIATCWDVTAACKNKAQVNVFRALETIVARFPFKVLGIDSDNGSEFINAHLLNYCTDNEITFTRSRAHRKNDSCFVEQKNYSVVRRNVGYLRHDTEEELKVLNELYIYLDDYVNFFQPVVKLELKIRDGSRVTKKYDRAKTPFRRVLESSDIDDKIKARLRRRYDRLNPADLKRKITRLQDRLLKLNRLKQKTERQSILNEPAYGHITR